MAVSRTQFLVRFPEFNNSDLPTALIDETLLEAHEVVNATIWGSKRNLGIKYYTAMLLADAAFGEPSRLSDDDRKTRYEVRYNQVKRMVTVGFRVTSPA